MDLINHVSSNRPDLKHPLRIINLDRSKTYKEFHQDDVYCNRKPEGHTEHSSCGTSFVLDRCTASYDYCMAIGGAQWIRFVKPVIIIDRELELATIPGLPDMLANGQLSSQAQGKPLASANVPILATIAVAIANMILDVTMLAMRLIARSIHLRCWSIWSLLIFTHAIAKATRTRIANAPAAVCVSIWPPYA